MNRGKGAKYDHPNPAMNGPKNEEKYVTKGGALDEVTAFRLNGRKLKSAT